MKKSPVSAAVSRLLQPGTKPVAKAFLDEFCLEEIPPPRRQPDPAMRLGFPENIYQRLIEVARKHQITFVTGKAASPDPTCARTLADGEWLWAPVDEQPQYKMTVLKPRAGPRAGGPYEFNANFLKLQFGDKIKLSDLK